MKTNFETQVCSRCHGSGSFSYCQSYGSRCFKCSGSGKTLTKRGEVARAYFEELCTIPANTVKVGDRIAATGITMGGQVYSYIGTVTGIKSRDAVKTTIKTTRIDGALDVSHTIEYTQSEGFSVLGSSGGTVERTGEAGTIVENFTEFNFTVSSKYGEGQVMAHDHDKVRVYPADSADKIKQALEYQAGLTKSGTIAKTKNLKGAK